MIVAATKQRAGGHRLCETSGMVRGAKKFLQYRIWDVMDYLQVRMPSLWRFIKKRVPRYFKQTVLSALTTKDPDIMFEEDIVRARKGEISYIISTDGGGIDLSKIFGLYALPLFDHKEIVVVSSEEVGITGAWGRRVKRADTLPGAVMAAKGSYICLLTSRQTFIGNNAFEIKKIIESNPADIYIGNYKDRSGELVNIYPSGLKTDFSEAAIPADFANGLIIISREAAIRARLPKDSTFEYLLSVSDYTNKVAYIEKALIKANSDADRKENVAAQSALLKKRLIYSGKSRPEGIKKILFIVPYLVIGGAEKVLLDLVTEYRKKGLAVDIFCTHGRGDWAGRFEKTGAKVCVAKVGDMQSIVSQIYKQAEKGDYDVIHTSNTEYGHFFSLWAHKLKKRPVLVDTVHSQNNPLCLYTKRVQASLDAVITVNRIIKEKLSEEIEEDRLKVVYNGVSLPQMEPRSVDDKFAKPEITYLGRISDEKNPLEFVKIVAALAAKHADWRYRVIGDGPMLGKMQAFAKELKVGGKIEFLGAVKEGVREMKDSSCYVLTSYTEGLPITILEAINLGIPTVSSGVGGIPEVIKSGENGYLVEDPENTAAYVSAIEALFADKKNYKKMSQNNSRIATNYSAEKMAQEVLGVYSEALAKLPKPFTKRTTVAMLSYNRTSEIKRTLETIYKNTDIPFDVVVLDNKSEKDTRAYLTKLSKAKSNVEVIYSDCNLGCPKGRRKILESIKADYIVTMDNDMEVPKHWLRDLILRLEEDKKIMGVCVKDIFPWGKVEFTGGKIGEDMNGFALFMATNYRKNYDDLSTLEEFNCDWIPGGATLWRGNIKEIAEHAKEYVNAFEDFDYSLQIVRKGYRIVNCPNVMFVHNHASGYGKEQKQKEAKYLRDRNDAKGFLRSLAVFYKRTGFLIKNDVVFQSAGISLDATPKEVATILSKEARDVDRMKV